MSTEQEKKQELTDQEKAQCNILEDPKYAHLDGGKIADLRRRGLLSERSFTDVYELMGDPNKTKDGTKYRNLITAITNGNLPDRPVLSGGKTKSIISILIADLKASYKPAEELMNSLKTRSNSSLSKYKETAYLTEKAENIKKEGVDVSELISGIRDSSAEKTAVPKRESNWEAEELSKERKEEMTELLKASTELLRELNKKYAEFKSNPNDLLESEIKDLEAKLADMKTLFDERDMPYFERNVLRFRELSRMTRYQGIDLNYVKKLKLKSGKYIEIEKIFFENPELLNLPGQLSIKFKDENGRENTMDYLVFVKNILNERNSLTEEGEGAYQEMKSKKELDENITELTGYKELEVGDVFCAKDYNHGDNGFEEFDTELRILEIKDDGDEGVIKLSGDHEDMNFGQFSKFLFGGGYQRKFKDYKDIQRGMDGSAKATNKRLYEMQKGMPEDWKLLGPNNTSPIQIPEEGGETPIVKDGRNGYLRGNLKDGLKFTERPLIATSDAEEPFREGNEKITEISPEDLARETNRGNIKAVKNTDKDDDDEENEKKKIATEALPFDMVNKIGGMTTEEKGYLSSLYAESYFMSGSDIWEMLKTMWEYYKRRQERRQKERYSKLGTNLPFFSPEMRRVKQAAENESVNSFKEELEQAGVDEIQEELRTTKNQDRMKACFIVLSAKGQMNWKDIDMWRNLNTFVRPEYYIPIPSNGDPETMVSDSDRRTGADFVGPAIDSLWGKGGYNDYFSQNKGAYESGVTKFYEKGKEMEYKDAGFEYELERLLHKHKSGEYVDPQEYEAILSFIIDIGKSNMPVKIYYMVQGVAAENPDGKTILGFDRISHMNSKFMGKFPLMDYMVAKVLRPDGKESRLKLDDYKNWAREFDDGNRMNCKPNKKVEDFLWETVLQSDPTQMRIEKAVRMSENIDHDDAYAFIPLLSSEMITDVSKIIGTKRFFSPPGYKNIFPGMNHLMKSLVKTNDNIKLKEAIKSYVRFDAIMTDRWDKGKSEYQRLGMRQLETKTGVGDYSPRYYMKELREMVNKMVIAYENDLPELKKAGELIFNEDPKTKADQDKIQEALVSFDKIMDKIMGIDGGQKMMAIVSGSKLTGMQMYKN